MRGRFATPFFFLTLSRGIALPVSRLAIFSRLAGVRLLNGAAGEASVSEYREDFIQALRQGKQMRDCVFRVLEQRHTEDFANGSNGVKYYTDVFDAVRAADVPEAVEEFERRFSPLLDPDGTRARGAPPADAATTASSRQGGWLGAALSTAALLAATFLWLSAVPTPPKRSLALTAPAVTAAIPEPTTDLPEATADRAAPADPGEAPVQAPAGAPDLDAVSSEQAAQE
jgi:hypothetical protein